jgi:4-hydroxy-tetrahydrodipicolinate reductase
VIRLGLLGASGRMGQWVTRLVESEFASQATLGAKPGRGASPEALLEMDAVIDFSLPEAMLPLAQAAIGKKGGSLPAFVVGSTGWKTDGRDVLEKLAQRTPVILASNFSTGVLALQEILKSAAPLLEKLGYTPVILDTHHRHKKDAPSGTALSLQRAIAPSGPGNVQTHSIRAGEVIGDHEITFYGPGDHLTIGHFAQDRSIFARGAIDAALWLAAKRSDSKRPAGLIGMDAFFRERYTSS